MTQRRHGPSRVLARESHMRSLPFSNRWELTQADSPVATMVRYPREFRSTVRLADGTEWSLEPTEWGVVAAIEDGEVIAEIRRTSWWGRRWDVEARTFSYNLVSRPGPRRWFFAAGKEPVAEWAGSPVSYNRLTIWPSIGIPVVAALLTWQVVCRPWENSARPVTSARAGAFPGGTSWPEAV